jgi:hypothetical protein
LVVENLKLVNSAHTPHITIVFYSNQTVEAAEREG